MSVVVLLKDRVSSRVAQKFLQLAQLNERKKDVAKRKKDRGKRKKDRGKRKKDGRKLPIGEQRWRRQVRRHIEIESSMKPKLLRKDKVWSKMKRCAGVLSVWVCESQSQREIGESGCEKVCIHERERLSERERKN